MKNIYGNFHDRWMLNRRLISDLMESGEIANKSVIMTL